MAEVDSTRSTSKFWIVFLTVLILVGVGGAALLTMRPDLFSFGSDLPVGQVSISPQEAVSQGAQWRLVSKWQAAGGVRDAEVLHLVEFKPVPGWETPAAVLLRKGERNARVEGVYAPASYAEQTILTFAGASTLANRLVPELAQLYLTYLGASEVRRIPGKNADEFTVQGIFYATREIKSIQIQGRGTPSGIEALKERTCDVAMLAQKLSPLDAKAMGEGAITSESGSRLAMDGVAVVVHKDNPVANLTVAEVGKIFSGEITNWEQVGGPSAPIKILALRDTFGTRRFFERVFLGGRGFAPATREVDVHSMIPEYVSQDPWAIGFCSISMAAQCREMPIRKDVDSEAVAPSPQNIRSLAYPASRSMYLYVRADSPNVFARDFIRVSLGAAGQEIVGRFGFVPAEDGAVEDASGVDAEVPSPVVSQPQEGSAPAVLKAPPLTGALPQLIQLDGEAVSDGTRRKVLQDYLDGVFEAERLPIVLRFVPGKPDLDQQAIRDVSRVAAMMQEPRNANKTVILVGYSDSVGAYASNLAASRKRAEAVEQALKAKGVRSILVLAAGEEGAVEPNESRVGRENNRRVEVWLK